jgi:hypothetical protein
MDNETKLSPQQIQSLLAALQSEKSGETVDVNAFVGAHLTAEQADAVRRLLQNPTLVKALLNSSKAKKLMEQFGKAPSDT